MTEEIEEWRPIKGLPGYEVSNLGAARSFLRKHTPKPITLKISMWLKYPTYYFGKSQPVQKRIPVNELVLEAFESARPTVDHIAENIDGDPLNNRLANLRWKQVANGIGEEWRDTEFAGYQVSNLGRVRSFRTTCSGEIKGKFKILKQMSKHQRGYSTAALCVDGRRKNKRVSGLVLGAFVGPRPVGHEASHLDGNRSNNSLLNLKWETHTENMARRDGHGTTAKWERSGTAKLTRGVVIQLRLRHANGESFASLARECSVSDVAVRCAVVGKTWKGLDQCSAENN